MDMPPGYTGQLPQDAEAYLHRLRWALRPLPEDERAGIVAEIRAHIAAQAALGGTSWQKLLSRLGPPEQLARNFVADYELSGAINRPNPWRLALTVLSYASRSFTAVLTGTLAVLLYLFSAVFLLIALLKPFMPGRVGAWWSPPDTMVLGIPEHTAAPGAELLGWSIIPVCAVAGVLCLLAGQALLRFAGRRLIHRAERARRQAL